MWWPPDGKRGHLIWSPIGAQTSQEQPRSSRRRVLPLLLCSRDEHLGGGDLCPPSRGNRARRGGGSPGRSRRPDAVRVSRNAWWLQAPSGARSVGASIVACGAKRSRLRRRQPGLRLPPSDTSVTADGSATWGRPPASTAPTTDRYPSTPGAVTPARLPLRPRLDDAGAGASLLLRRRAPVSRDCWSSSRAVVTTTRGRAPLLRREPGVRRASSPWSGSGARCLVSTGEHEWVGALSGVRLYGGGGA
jgi:hypothetical protein